MSKRAQTVRDCGCECNHPGVPGEVGTFINSGCVVLGYHIIPTANAVVTQGGLETAADALVDKMDTVFERAHGKEPYRRLALAVLESLNITVVNEVWHQRHSNCLLTSLVEPEEPKWQQTDIEPGDILYIKRKED